MKTKIFASALLSLASVSAMAIPAPTESLMKALSFDGKLAEALEGEQNIESVEISRVTDIRSSETLRMLCGQDLASRSASVLQVKINFVPRAAAVQSKSKYFVTTESASTLRLCDGQN